MEAPNGRYILDLSQQQHAAILKRLLALRKRSLVAKEKREPPKKEKKDPKGRRGSKSSAAKSSKARKNSTETQESQGSGVIPVERSRRYLAPNGAVWGFSPPLEVSQRRLGCPFRNLTFDSLPVLFGDLEGLTPEKLEGQGKDGKGKAGKDAGKKKEDQEKASEVTEPTEDTVYWSTIPLQGCVRFDYFSIEETLNEVLTPCPSEEYNEILRAIADMPALSTVSTVSEAVVMRKLKSRFSRKRISAKQAGKILSLLERTGPSLMIDACVSMLTRIHDSEHLPHLYACLGAFPKVISPVRQSLTERVGNLYLANPFSPWGKHCLDLTCLDDKFLLELIAEVGEDESHTHVSLWDITHGKNVVNTLSELKEAKLGQVNFLIYHDKSHGNDDKSLVSEARSLVEVFERVACCSAMRVDGGGIDSEPTALAAEDNFVNY